MQVHLQTSCPYCLTVADTNPNRTGVFGYAVPTVGQCLCGKTKLNATKEK